MIAQVEPWTLLRNWDDRRVVAELHALLQRGRILWLEPPPPLRPIQLPASAAPPPPPPPPPPGASRASPAQTTPAQSQTDASTFPATVDQACLADTMTKAAANGVPFCEECQAASNGQAG